MSYSILNQTEPRSGTGTHFDFNPEQYGLKDESKVARYLRTNEELPKKYLGNYESEDNGHSLFPIPLNKLPLDIETWWREATDTDKQAYKKSWKIWKKRIYLQPQEEEKYGSGDGGVKKDNEKTFSFPDDNSIQVVDTKVHSTAINSHSCKWGYLRYDVNHVVKKLKESCQLETGKFDWIHLGNEANICFNAIPDNIILPLDSSGRSSDNNHIVYEDFEGDINTTEQDASSNKDDPDAAPTCHIADEPNDMTSNERTGIHI